MRRLTRRQLRRMILNEVSRLNEDETSKTTVVNLKKKHANDGDSGEDEYSQKSEGGYTYLYRKGTGPIYIIKSSKKRSTNISNATAVPYNSAAYKAIQTALKNTGVDGKLVYVQELKDNYTG